MIDPDEKDKAGMPLTCRAVRERSLATCARALISLW